MIAYEQRSTPAGTASRRAAASCAGSQTARPYEGHQPEYETLATVGTYCDINDLEAVMTMNEICNRAGLDTISAGATIAFAMECYERDLLSTRIWRAWN